MNKLELISHSTDVQAIIKGVSLTKSLRVSTIIWGEPYTGKQILIRSIFPKATFIDAQNIEELHYALKEHDELIIYNFETITNIQSLDLENKRIVAIANYSRLPSSIEKYFAFIYLMPSLKERTEDVIYFAEKFSQELKNDLLIENDIKVDINQLDLSKNFKSLKISLHRELVKKNLSQKDIEEILFEHLYTKIAGVNAYRENIALFEKPLIQAGLKKFKSQLKLSAVLGLNRNTLRKKIHEHDIN